MIMANNRGNAEKTYALASLIIRALVRRKNADNVRRAL